MIPDGNAMNGDDNEIAELNDFITINKFIKYDMMGGGPSIDVDINGNVIRCLLNTGATISVIEYYLLRRLGRFRINETDTKIKCANESSLKIIGITTVGIKINDQV